MKKFDKNINNLLLSLKNGDKSAFRSIFNIYQKKLYCFVFSITKSDYATEEILQEVFIKIWTIRKTIDFSYSFNSFIYTIARNHTYNYLRSVANQESLKQELWRNLEHFSRQTENTILLNEYEDLVIDILNNLPLKTRRIFILSKRQGKNNQEIADLLGVSPKTVKNNLWKTLQLLRIKLQPHIEVAIAILLFVNYN